MTAVALPVGSEFPDENHRREFTIDGEKVHAVTYIKSVGGREKVSAVYIGVNDPDVKHRIKEALNAQGRFSHDNKNPLSGSIMETGFYVTDPEELLSAIQILDAVSEQLEYLQGTSRIARAKRGKRADVAEDRAGMLQDRFTASDDPAVSRLLEAVYAALDNAYNLADTPESVVSGLMTEVKAQLESRQVAMKLSASPLNKINLSWSDKAERLCEETKLLEMVQEIFPRHLEVSSESSSQHQQAYRNCMASLAAELKQAVINILNPAGPEEGKGTITR